MFQISTLWATNNSIEKAFQSVCGELNQNTNHPFVFQSQFSISQKASPKSQSKLITVQTSEKGSTTKNPSNPNRKFQAK
jgi:hypothetical protein